MPVDTKKIRKLMGHRTQSEVAAAAGMRQPNLVRLLRERHDPRLSAIDRLAAALHVSAKELLK